MEDLKTRIYNLRFKDLNWNMLQYIQNKYKEEPMSFLKVDDFDAEHITDRVTKFLKNYSEKSNTNGYVIGLSGGIDSSVAAALAVKAVGKENVFGMLLPSKFTSQEHIDDALELANQLGIKTNNYKKVQEFFDICIQNTLNMSEISGEDPNFKLIVANNHARERMKILRSKAKSLNYLVLGTTNMTEAWLGYATIAGDGYKGVDIEPIQMLPKTSEREYAKYLLIPEKIIDKAPTAGLWEGQTDEGEIGMSYEDIDRIMAGFFISKKGFENFEGPRVVNIDKLLTDKELEQIYCEGLSMEDIIKANNKKTISKKSIKKILQRVEANAFKARPEPYANLTKSFFI
ncbi:MAG: NAD(+) synthase [Nanoarchaeota archaeon]|nr:NAD(+) synthase [Nanoarchaeota archaeon]MCG2719144.1 NAD(+) synthase [Nanoarchaeota archaeon]